jgi:glycosyltransferase involved in cell wall biosynthesis
MPARYLSWDIRTTWVDRLPGVHAHHQRALPAFPLAFERLRLPDCDLVLSSSSAFAKMVRPPRGATHICYTHSPMRFAWSLDQYLEREPIAPAARFVLRPLMAALRARDRSTLSRVHRFVANSTAVRDRIRAFWRRDAAVIYPPVNVERFRTAPALEMGDYFLMVSRLVPYKRFDLAIEAFNALRLPLWIVGDGRDRAALQAAAGPTVRFLGRVGDDELEELYARCQAAIFMSEDDFGIAQVEVQAAGRPAIALAAGGAFDTVVDGETGILVARQDARSLIDAIQRFERTTFDPSRLTEHAASFSRYRFASDLTALVEETMAAVRAGDRYRWN